MTVRFVLGMACLLGAMLPLSPARAQGGPPTILPDNPYGRAVLCAATLAFSAQAVRDKDATVAAKMEDGMGRWLLRGVNLAPKAGRTVEQMNSAVKFQLDMLPIFIKNPQDQEKILQNVGICGKEAALLPSR